MLRLFTERFCYDALNRLTNYNIGAACTGGSTAAYDAIGNITAKSGTGSYSYSGGRPHAVSAITGTVDGLNNPQYSYDANGNLTCVSSGASCGGSVGRTVGLTSFNMAATLAQNGTSLALSYDDQHQRIRQVTTGPAAPVTTDYLNDPASGAMSLRVTTGTGLPTFTDYITLDGQIVAQRSVQYAGSPAWGGATWGAFKWGPAAPAVAAWNAFNWGSTNWSGVAWGGFKWGAAPWSGPIVNWAYFTLDHLGSVAVIANQSGNVVQRLSYDAWGKQRNADGSAATCGAITSTTTKGFTNQEQMPAGCIVNLNARLYDPSIGKFMAADSIVPDAFDGQSYNRYSYVTNNPLSLTDVTGHDESVTVTGYRPPALTGASSLSYGGFFGDSDPASPHATAPTSTAPPSIANPSQKDAMHRERKDMGTCSRVGINGCSGSDWLGNGYRTAANDNSRGEKTFAADFSQGIAVGPGGVGLKLRGQLKVINNKLVGTITVNCQAENCSEIMGELDQINAYSDNSGRGFALKFIQSTDAFPLADITIFTVRNLRVPVQLQDGSIVSRPANGTFGKGCETACVMNLAPTALPSTPVHELGHYLGLTDSDKSDTVMGAAGRNRPGLPSQGEVRDLINAYQKRD